MGSFHIVPQQHFPQRDLCVINKVLKRMIFHANFAQIQATRLQWKTHVKSTKPA